MPYIKQSRRKELAQGKPLNSPGDLEYSFTKLVEEYLQAKGLSHQTIAEIRGTLHGTISEFDRRVSFPYENSKLVVNGDVYTPRSPR